MNPRSFSQTLRQAMPLALLAVVFPVAAQVQDLTLIGHFNSGLGAGAAEISAFDPASRRLFVVNAAAASVDILDLANPAAPVKVGALDVTPFGTVANSVDVANGLVAVAVEAATKQDPGQVVFFSTAGVLQRALAVGALPDMVTFTPDGQRVLVANEGEPSDDYSVDPVGSVSVIELGAGLPAATVTTIGFTDFNAGGSRAAELPPGIRIFGPNASVAQDLEPEYIAVAADGKKAWVTLQENNALAILDLQNLRVESLAPLGFKNHSLPNAALDPSDRDGGINIGNWPIFGMYQPDAIAAFVSGASTLLITANEGDARAYGGFSEEERGGDLNLDPQAFVDANALQEDAALGRLRTTSALGDLDGDGDFDRFYSFGGRSFSIWSAEGHLVWDSGDTLERTIASLAPSVFVDSRSDDKGPEPEGVVTGQIEGRTYAFLGLERSGGVMVFDISLPLMPSFRHFEPNAAGDVSPEGLEFVPAASSPNGRPLLIVANEVSGTVAIYQIDSAPAAGACTPDALTLCLNGGRFEVGATFKTPMGATGVAQATALTNDSGTFYFFDPNNVELVVKVLDGCALSSSYWIFGAGLTNLEVELRVRDTESGTVKTFRNPAGQPFQPILDVTSFATCP